MSVFRLLYTIIRMKQRLNWNRDQILSYQDSRFRSILQYAWKYSKFYREFYGDHGIKESDLRDISFQDLPFMQKKLLMAHFDDVVTDQKLSKKEIENWISKFKLEKKFFLNKYTIFHSSGTSGHQGIYVYDQMALDTLNGIIATRMTRSQYGPFKPIKLAYFALTHGRFAGIVLANNLPKWPYNLKSLSVLDPIEETVETLNLFQPDVLTCFVTPLCRLTKEVEDGRLKINPSIINFGGESCTKEMRNRIERAFSQRTYQAYGCSESVLVASENKVEKNMVIAEDELILEILDENKKEVIVGDSGEVVLSNLYNYTMPMIRYQMFDVAKKGPRATSSNYNTIESIIGRASSDALPIILDNGKKDEIHPVHLAELVIPGMNQIQFISKGLQNFHVKYVSQNRIENEISNELSKLLSKLGASQKVSFSIEQCNEIPMNKESGKFQLVVKEAIT